MSFDYKMMNLIKSGQFDAAKRLIMKKYPHIGSDRAMVYVVAYQKLIRRTN